MSQDTLKPEVGKEPSELEKWKEETKKTIREEERATAKELLLVWQTRDLAELEKKMDEQVQAGMEKKFEEWKEQQKPLTKEQIQELVSQAYVTFDVKLFAAPPDNPDGEESEMTFTIREVPKSVEEKFYAAFKKGLLDNLPKLNALQQANMDKTYEEKMRAMLEAIDGGLDLMSRLCAIVLDPKGKKGITEKWVSDNLASSRQWNIIQAQLEANRLRDFFSKVSQSGQTIQTMTQPLSYRALLEQPA